MNDTRKNADPFRPADASLPCPRCGYPYSFNIEDMESGLDCPCGHVFTEDELNKAANPERHDGLKEFAFDCFLRAAVRIRAKDQAEAERILDEKLDAVGPEECPEIREVSLMDTESPERKCYRPELYEIVHEDGRVENLDGLAREREPATTPSK